ncbi:unnamed protein product, partial [Rangifer tarandus platyrhynchus]
WAAETSDLYYSYSGGWTSQTKVSEGQILLRSPSPACRQLSSHFVLRHQHPSSLCGTTMDDNTRVWHGRVAGGKDSGPRTHREMEVPPWRDSGSAWRQGLLGKGLVV